jgi:hypothetical protein
MNDLKKIKFDYFINGFIIGMLFGAFCFGLGLLTRQ